MPISTIGSNSLNQTSDLTINGQTVGKGGGNASTNTVHGVSTLTATNTIGDCTAVGYQALKVTTGKQNTAVGSNAGASMTSGEGLAAFGWNAANLNTGDNNTAIGHNSLGANTTASNNTACGNAALNANTTGASNVAVGRQALVSNTTASNNTAVGFQAGNTNSTGPHNTFVGTQAGYSSTGGENTCVGRTAGYSISTGTGNTFIGPGNGATSNGAGYFVTTGSKNSILGGYNGNQGSLDIRTASNYIVLSDGDGNPRQYINSSGNIFFPLVRGSAGSYAARFTGSLELTVDTSSARYKDNIRDSIYGLADLLKIQSRQFEYKDDGRSDVGFIAEEMVEVIPEVVAIDKQGRPDAVSYDRLVSVCVKAIQELKTIVDAQAAEIAELKAKVA
jgi:hypothetical protein